MPKPRPSITKRQREQAKRDRKVLKAEKRAQRKNEPDDDPSLVSESELVMETALEPDPEPPPAP